MKQSEDILEYIKEHFSDSKNKDIAKNLNISISTVIRGAKQLGLKKSDRFLDQLRTELIRAQRDSYNKNKKEYCPTKIQQNIIVGSVLGDGSLALYGKSKNAYFRERGCEKQKEYRQWKCNQLSSLDFKLDGSGKLHSPSHPIYTNLYNKFYTVKGKKYISKDNIALLNHPIGLACLYMDDGTLVIDSSQGSRKKYLFPRIAMYTLCFSLEENILLQEHIQQTFHIPFKLKKRPDGKNYILELNQRNYIFNFIDIIKPYVSQIPCMSYKINLNSRMVELKGKLSGQDKEIIISNKPIRDLTYSIEEERQIIAMKKIGSTDAEIADCLKRSYWGIVDKIRRLREMGKFKEQQLLFLKFK